MEGMSDTREANMRSFLFAAVAALAFLEIMPWERMTWPDAGSAGALAPEIRARLHAAAQAWRRPRDNLHMLVRYAAWRNGLDPALVAAVMVAESGGDPCAVSSAGAMGLMQLMPQTAEALLPEGGDPFRPVDNVLAGARLLGRLVRAHGLRLGLAAYNAGERAFRRPWPGETRRYVPKVLRLYRRFKAGQDWRAFIPRWTPRASARACRRLARR